MPDVIRLDLVEVKKAAHQALVQFTPYLDDGIQRFHQRALHDALVDAQIAASRVYDLARHVLEASR
jgi:hypothetical protein